MHWHLKGVVEERLRYYHESRLHSGLGYRTPKEVMEEALGQNTQDITREAG
jgi:putative transposase